MLTQRNRRMEPKDEGYVISPLAFTPATKIMMDLNQVLGDWIIKYIFQQKNEKLFFSMSGYDRQGEGELKIFEFLNSLPLNPEEKSVVIGNDSDLFLFALRSQRKIKILRLEKMNSLHLWDIDTLKKNLLELDPRQDPRILDDFTLLSILSGNDYFPKLRGYSFLKTWKTYLKMKEKNPDFYLYDQEKVTINWSCFKSIISKAFSVPFKRPEKFKQHPKSTLQLIIQKYLGQKYIPIYEYESEGIFVCKVLIDNQIFANEIGANKRDASFKAALQTLHSPKFKKFLKEKTKNQSDYNSALLYISESHGEERDIELSENLKTTSVNEKAKFYIEAIIWVMEYLRGKCQNYYFFYPFTISPQVDDLLAFSEPPPLQRNDSQPLTPFEFFISIMPKESKKFLPEFFQSLIKPGSELETLLSDDWNFSNLMDKIQKLKIITKSIDPNSLREEEKSILYGSPALLFKHVKEPAPDYIFLTPPSIEGMNRGFPKFPLSNVVCLSENQKTGNFDLVENFYMKKRTSPFIQKRTFTTQKYLSNPFTRNFHLLKRLKL